MQLVVERMWLARQRRGVRIEEPMVLLARLRERLDRLLCIAVWRFECISNGSGSGVIELIRRDAFASPLPVLSPANGIKVLTQQLPVASAAK